MTTKNFWVGAVTDTTLQVVAVIEGIEGRLVVSDNEADLFTAPTYESSPVVADEGGAVRFTAVGLGPDTDYFYKVSDAGAWSEVTGRVRTFPVEGSPASFTIAASSCAGHQHGGLTGGTTFWPEGVLSMVSNAKVFDHIRDKQPKQFIHMGDLHYRDIKVDDPAPRRQAYDDVLSAPRQAALYRDIPIAYTWDDHDYCGNDSNKNSMGRSAAAQVYRERVPHYPLNDSAGTWQTWVIGRVRFIMSDVRSYQDPLTDPYTPTRTPIGTKQEQWFMDTCLAAEEPLICWVNPMPWAANRNQGNWDQYPEARSRITNFLIENGIADRMFMLSGDWHGMGFDDGTNNRWGGFPLYQVGPMDSSPSEGVAGTFSHGMNRARGQYGVITVQDDGDTITVLAEGYRNEDVVMTHSFSVRQAAPEPSEPVTSLVPVTAAHYGADTVATWKTVYNGEVINVIAAHVGALSR